MLNLYKRWRIAKSIESGGPMPRSLMADLERSPNLRAYADAMQRVHAGLRVESHATEDIGMAQRVLLEIERGSTNAPSRAGDSSGGGQGHTRSALRGRPVWLARPIGLSGPVGLAAAVVVVAGVTLAVVRPWAAGPTNTDTDTTTTATIEVTGEFTTLASFFRPLDDQGVMVRMDRSLTVEMDALAQDAQEIIKGVFEGIPGADLIDPERANQPG